jgi:hypothetical protein
MPDKLILQVKEPEPTGRGSCNVRISNDSAKAIRDLAHKTRQTDREIADLLIAFALDRVELVPVELYDMRLPEETPC